MKLTQTQQYEASLFAYPAYYHKWLREARAHNYSSVTVMLEDLYRDRTTGEIGVLLGFTQSAVWKMMKRLGLRLRKPAHER